MMYTIILVGIYIYKILQIIIIDFNHLEIRNFNRHESLYLLHIKKYT